MIRVSPPNYRFCPFCRGRLEIRTEEEKEQKYCPVCQWTYYPRMAASVSAVIVRGSKTLMVKRAREPFKGTWMFPSGFVDFGEHVCDALVREVREETGLTVTRATLLGIFQSPDDLRELGHHVFFFLTETDDHALVTDDEENCGIEWFDIGKPPTVGWELHKRFVAALQKGGLEDQGSNGLSYDISTVSSQG